MAVEDLESLRKHLYAHFNKHSGGCSPQSQRDMVYSIVAVERELREQEEARAALRKLNL